jgi:hypothetical protein
MLRTSPLWLCLPLGLLLAPSCGSDGDSGPPNAEAGNGGERAGSAGEPNAAASGQGAASSNGGSDAGSNAGSDGGHAGAPLTTAGAPTSGSGGAQGGASPELGGAGGAAGASETTGGAPPLVAEASCLQHEDCLQVCQANGWPQAHCFGSSERYCSCESSGEPSCTKGTTQGCPAGTACRGPHQCMPFRESAHGDPCDNGDECAPGLICVGFGNPLPNGNSTACATMCDAQTAAPGCDCLAGYCWGGLGLYDFTCDYPQGTPCNQSVFANDTKRGQITGTGEITPGYVYVVSLESQANVDLEVCGSKDCHGDHLCVSGGASGGESCIVQATKDSLDVYVVNRAGSSATVAVNVEADLMTEYKLSYTQMGSSLGANRSFRLLVTGLTPGQKYDFNVATANARDINLTVTNDLHGEQGLCDEDLVGAAAACELTVTQAAVWVVLTDTSGIGDGYTFKVTAK